MCEPSISYYHANHNRTLYRIKRNDLCDAVEYGHSEAMTNAFGIACITRMERKGMRSMCLLDLVMIAICRMLHILQTAMKELPISSNLSI